MHIPWGIACCWSSERHWVLCMSPLVNLYCFVTVESTEVHVNYENVTVKGNENNSEYEPIANYYASLSKETMMAGMTFMH